MALGDRSEGVRHVLLDNGSLKAEATLSLRRVASRLSDMVGRQFHPVSILHSSKIDPVELDGVPAQTWRRFLKGQLADGVGRLEVVPLFVGPSGAIVDYLPRITKELVGAGSNLVCKLADPLLRLDCPEDSAVAALIERELRAMLQDGDALEAPGVVLVDHGSPKREVAQCRDLAARQLASLMTDSGLEVIAASMESREGEEYSFNEPLLESALETARMRGWREILLAHLFFSPGRHAGPGGDIDAIVQRSRFVAEGGRALRAPLLGELPGLPKLLANRYREAFGA